MNIKLAYRRTRWYLRDLWLDFKAWAWHRYTTVKPRNLPHRWVDRDHQMLHCVFEILSLFVEQEMSKENIRAARDPNFQFKSKDEDLVKAINYQVETNREILKLYDWWVNEYPKYSIADGDYLSFQKEAEEEKIVEDMLIRVMKVRNYLWS